MKPVFRDYQEEAAKKIWEAINEGHFGNKGGVIADICTGAGKTLVINATLIKFLTHFPKMEALCLTTSPELVEQNFAMVNRFFPNITGIYCAQLGKKQVKQITIGSVGSVARRPELFKNVSLIIVDETHQGLKDNLEIKKAARSLMRKNEIENEEEAIEKVQGQLRRFLNWHLQVKPNRALIGLSGTPERYGNISLVGTPEECIEGKYLYSKVAASITTNTMMDEGWLKRISTFMPKEQVDLSGVKVERGEFDIEDLGAKFCAIENAGVHVEALAKYAPLQPENGQILIFCVNVAHIDLITKLANEHPIMRQHGFKTAALHHNIGKKEREQIIDDFRYGRGGLKCLASGAILQVGFDMKNRITNHEVSMILGLCPTKSSIRYRQREIGRAVRPFYARNPENLNLLDERFDLETKDGRLASLAASQISHCLYISFDGNPREHSAVSEELEKSGKLKNSEAPIKVCPKCHGKVAIAALICNSVYEFDIELDDGGILRAGEACAYEFPPPVRGNEKEAYRGDIKGLAGSGQAIEKQLGTAKVKVLGASYFSHQSKKSGNTSLKIEYLIELNNRYEQISEWVPIESKQGRYLAGQWWHQVCPSGTARPCPYTVKELLSMQEKLRKPSELTVQVKSKNNPFIKVLKREFSPDS